jgi:hypothetical protein
VVIDLKKKKGCASCSINLALFRGQLAEKDRQLVEERDTNSKLIRENEGLQRSVEGLLNDKGDLMLRLNKAEIRGIAVPLARGNSREAKKWSDNVHGQPLRQSWVSSEERKDQLLQPFKYN